MKYNVAESRNSNFRDIRLPKQRNISIEVGRMCLTRPCEDDHIAYIHFPAFQTKARSMV